MDRATRRRGQSKAEKPRKKKKRGGQRALATGKKKISRRDIGGKLILGTGGIVKRCPDAWAKKKKQES